MGAVTKVFVREDESPSWPIEYPERSATFANARLAIVHQAEFGVDVARILAGAITDGDREVIAYLLGAAESPLIKAAAEAALNVVP